MSQPTPNAAKSTLEGTVPSLATSEERKAAMVQVFDYRGERHRSTLSDGRVIEGYVFDRRSNIPDPIVRVMPRNSDERVNIRYADIVGLVFSGRDTAAGKSWETWVKKYIEKKSKGEKANMESEPLE